MKNILFYLLLVLATPALGQQVQWERTYSFLLDDGQLQSLQPDPAGGYAALFGERTYGVPSEVMARLNAQGDTLWTRRIPGNVFSEVIGAMRVVQGGYLMTAFQYDPNNPLDSIKLQVVRYRSNGSLHWSRSYTVAGRSDVRGRAITIAGPNEYLILSHGHSRHITIAQGGGDRFIVHNLDSMGNVSWQKLYLFQHCLRDLQYANSILEYRPGAYMLYGQGYCYNYNSPHIVKINGNGDTIQTAGPFPGSYTNYYNGLRGNIVQAFNGDLITTSLHDNNMQNKKPYVSRIDTALNLQWVNIYPRLNHTEPQVIELADSTILMATCHQDSSRLSLLYYSATGQLIDSVFLPTTLGKGIRVRQLLADSDTSILVAGTITDTAAGTGLGLRAYLARITNTTRKGRVTATASDIVKPKALLGDAYPNPANSDVTITYSLPQQCNAAKLLVQEVVSGELVREVNLRKAEQQVVLKLSGLAPGIYSCTLVVDGIPIATKKLVLIL